MKRALTSLFLGILILIPAVGTASSPQLKFLINKDIPSLGLRIRIMPDSTAVPAPLPASQRYTLRAGDRVWTEDRYDPREIWWQSQVAARWGDQDGNGLVLGAMTKHYPRGLKNTKVTRQAYEQALAKVNPENARWDSNSVAQWVADFTGSQSARFAYIRKKPMSLSYLMRFSLQGSKENTYAYAFKLNPRAAGQHDAPDTWFFVMFGVNPEIDASKVPGIIEDKFFDYVTVSKRDTNIEKLSDVFQSKEFAETSDKSESMTASRKAAIDSIRNLKDWWYAETDNYILLSNLKRRHAVMIKQLQENVEFMRSAYSKLIPARAKIKSVSVLRVFATSEEYVGYVGSEMQWSAGIWIPSRKELVIRPMDSAGSKEQKERVYPTTYHEAFHQYISYALDQAPVSVWFNEGHAKFFENARIRGTRITIGEDEMFAKIVKMMIEKNFVHIPQLLAMTHAQFYGPGREQNYALAWALVYYLRKAAPLKKPAPYAGILDRYVDTLWKTRNGDMATQDAFKGINMDQFKKDFTDFWESRNERGKAERNRLFDSLRN